MMTDNRIFKYSKEAFVSLRHVKINTAEGRGSRRRGIKTLF